jgi:tol-pal system protein YbgF
MTRHWLPPRAPLAAMLGLLAVFVVPATAPAQDLSTEDRLDRLERDLSMLQRQVYRGVPPTMPGDPTAAANFEIRLERVEAEMRDLTGRVEQVANQTELLRQRIEQVNNDIDMRLGQAPGAAIGAGPPPLPGRRPTMLGAAGVPLPPAPPAPAAPGAPIAPGTVVPAPIFGTLTPPSDAAEAPRNPAGVPPAGGGAVSPGSPADQYNHALGLLKQADYSGAEQALRAFVLQHPDDPAAASAQYFVGEALFARGKYAEAASAFAEGYKRYPKGAKAPEDLLKLSQSLARINQHDNACIALTQLDRDFPNSSAAIKERAAAERKRLGC